MEDGTLMRARWSAAVAATLTTLGTVAAGAPAQAQTTVPTWAAGPDILHQAPATAPQLTNAAPWSAAPLLVSGAHAYAGGEFLYQDFLYDDTGANGGVHDPGDQRPGNEAFSAHSGTYSYPTDSRYAGNAADLVELRVKPVSGATAVRITLTQLRDPSVVAASVAFGTASSATRAFPYGANVTTQADHFLTIHGGTADFDGTSVPVTIDQNRAQLDARIPANVWDPGTSVVRMSAGVGLWNATAGAYALPQLAADASHPGGSGLLPAPAAFFNVAFRESEKPAGVPHPKLQDQSTVLCLWRDCSQSAALAQGDIGAFHDDVDFSRLQQGATDMSGVPATGNIDRIMSSHFDFGGGVTYAQASSQVDPKGYHGEYQGALQPYDIYVPSHFNANVAYPLTLLLHSLSANYNQFANSNNQSQLGERNGGTIVATSEARGPDGWYYEVAEADVFEMWADVAAHYNLDTTRTTISGYSMGGYATYKLGTRFPDLFARGFVTVGPPADGIWFGPGAPGTAGGSVSSNSPPPQDDRTSTYWMLDSLRWVPLMIWHGTNDELVPAEGPQLMARHLDDLGYRYEMDTFPGYDHFAFAFFDDYAAPAAFLGNSKVEADPPRVTYVVNPTMDFTSVSDVADHAYWLGGLTLRNTLLPRGTVDVRSEEFCTGDAPADPTQFGAGVAATPYTREYRTWGDAPAAPCADVLDITATNVSRIVVDAQRAKVDGNAAVNLHADGPVQVIIERNGTVLNSGTYQPQSAAGAHATVTKVAALPNTAAAGGGVAAAGGACAVLLASARVARRRRKAGRA